MNLNESLRFSDKRDIENTYIITIKNNEISERLAYRCLQSCRSVGQKAILWEAFDGTDDKTIKVPTQLENQQYWRWIKQPNDKYSTSQLAVFFSHLSLWAHCAAMDKPIVILEHDAIMIKPLEKHNYYNCHQILTFYIFFP